MNQSPDKQDLVQRLREMAKEWNPGDPQAADWAWQEYRALAEAADAIDQLEQSDAAMNTMVRPTT